MILRAHAVPGGGLAIALSRVRGPRDSYVKVLPAPRPVRVEAT
jgi:hypothetical protein